MDSKNCNDKLINDNENTLKNDNLLKIPVVEKKLIKVKCE